MSADSRTLRQHAVLMSELPQHIFDQIIGDLFDQPVIGNLYRPHYVERMIALALGEGFELVSADWAGWDIQSSGGVRIEIKQSAAWQTWTGRPSLGGRTTIGVYDIAPKTGYWSDGGSQWTAKRGRPADLYIFAWHPVTEPDTVDHRNPAQWLFYVVPTAELPAKQNTIRQSVVARQWPERRFSELREAVNDLLIKLPSKTHED